MKIGRFVLISRYGLIPLYVGMAISLGVFSIKFIQEVYHLFANAIYLSDSAIILKILSLVDLMLVANLLVMVTLSGYESFIGPFSGRAEDHPNWLGKLDINTIKVKVSTSLVGISSIHLLSAFLNIDTYSPEKMFWLVVIHIVFVISALLMTWIDRLLSD